ncbi:hypothetical protein ACSRUE_21315 [Sorangium sp. KYC3313]|uniref:hypothetical protein n=1 Tax=Sorangium sp. KYC3313 TaxID=3449740 RepID=UPI003F8CDBB7
MITQLHDNAMVLTVDLPPSSVGRRQHIATALSGPPYHLPPGNGEVQVLIYNGILRSLQDATVDVCVATVCARWDEGSITMGEALDAYLDVAVDKGIDAVLDRLDETFRHELLQVLMGWALAGPDPKIIRIFGGIYSYEREPDPIKAAQMKRDVEAMHAEEDAYFLDIALPRIRSWWAIRTGSAMSCPGAATDP